MFRRSKPSSARGDEGVVNRVNRRTPGERGGAIINLLVGVTVSAAAFAAVEQDIDSAISQLSSMNSLDYVRDCPASYE